MRFRAGLQILAPRPLKLIPNFALHGSGLNWDDPLIAAVRDAADGVLDEVGGHK